MDQVAPYQPSSRRPIAQRFRNTAQWAVRLCCRLQIHPDAVSCASVAASLVAALCFWYAARWPALLIVAPLFCYLRLWFNMLDGMVALASGKASRRGEIFNELPDRVSDLLVFVAIAHSALANVLLGYWAGIAALMTAYIGTLGQAAGAHRDYSGLMSKPWRMVVVHLGAWATFALISQGRLTTINQAWWPLNIACGVVILGCIQTITQRLWRILRKLNSL